MILKIYSVILLIVLIATGTYAQNEKGIASFSLDGKWEIIFDKKNEGVEERWYLNNNYESNSEVREIEIPLCWEEIEKDYEGVVFYRKKFVIPADWEGKIIHINFDAVNYVAECWLNNKVIDYHEGGFTPFSVRIDKSVKFGEENTLIIRVVGPIILSDKRVDNMGRQETPQWRGGIAGGIWQPVNVTASGAERIDDVYIETDIHEKSVSFTIRLESNKINSSEAELSLNITSAEGIIVAKKAEKLSLTPGKNEVTWVLDLPDAQLWSPDSPYLYSAKLELSSNNELSDVWMHEFGMREFTIRNKKFILNDKPIYLKATFFEGLYPVGIASPDSRAMAIKEILLAKEAGFNMIRPWRKPPPKMWLDLCDSIGILTVGSNVVECMHRPVSTPYLAERVESEITESVLRDRNRTCLVQWELFNEANRPVLQQMIHSMSVMVQELDPGRLVLDESGGTKGANFYLPYTTNPMRFNDIHTYPGGQVTREQYDRLLMIGKTKAEREALGLGRLSVPGRDVQPNLMSFLSELGYASWPDLVENNKQFREKGNPLTPAALTYEKLEHQVREAFKITGFNSAFPNLKDYCRAEQKIHGIANKRMIEATRANPTISGYCVHALTDGDWILGAAIVDLWRNPKTYVYDMTKSANQPQIVSIRILPRNMYAEKGGNVEVIGINELETVNATVYLNIVNNEGVIISSQSFSKLFQQGSATIYNEKIETSGLKGNYTLKVTVEDENGNIIAQNERSFDVFTKDQLKPAENRVAVVDNSDRITSFLEKEGVELIPFSMDLDVSVPVIVGYGRKRDAEFMNRIDEVKAFAERGGFVVFLEVSGTKLTWGASNPEPEPKDAGDNWHRMVPRELKDLDVDKLPFNADMYETSGNYISRNHIVTDHPIFNDLPVNILMSGVYENVCATQSICRPVKGNYLAGVITYDQQKNMDIMLRHYNGIGDVLWAADLLEVEKGSGKMLFSTLKLIPNLGKDPVADKILFNMIQYSKDLK